MDPELSQININKNGDFIDKSFENEEGSFNFKELLVSDATSPEEEDLKELKVTSINDLMCIIEF